MIKRSETLRLTGGKQYFFKYHPASNQGAVIVIDSYSKVIVDAECRIMINISQQELQSFIYERYSSIQSSESISVTYVVGEKSIKAKYNCSKDIYNGLVVGDTILVVYSLQCPDWNLPYKYFPTTIEIRQCKDGCLIKNGELLISD